MTVGVKSLRMLTLLCSKSGVVVSLAHYGVDIKEKQRFIDSISLLNVG